MWHQRQLTVEDYQQVMCGGGGVSIVHTYLQLHWLCLGSKITTWAARLPLPPHHDYTATSTKIANTTTTTNTITTPPPLLPPEPKLPTPLPLPPVQTPLPPHHNYYLQHQDCQHHYHCQRYYNPTTTTTLLCILCLLFCVLYLCDVIACAYIVLRSICFFVNP